MRHERKQERGGQRDERHDPGGLAHCGKEDSRHDHDHERDRGEGDALPEADRAELVLPPLTFRAGGDAREA
jgi:hypothetical protein